MSISLHATSPDAPKNTLNCDQSVSLALVTPTPTDEVVRYRPCRVSRKQERSKKHIKNAVSVGPMRAAHGLYQALPELCRDECLAGRSVGYVREKDAEGNELPAYVICIPSTLAAVRDSPESGDVDKTCIPRAPLGVEPSSENKFLPRTRAKKSQKGYGCAENFIEGSASAAVPTLSGNRTIPHWPAHVTTKRRGQRWATAAEIRHDHYALRPLSANAPRQKRSALLTGSPPTSGPSSVFPMIQPWSPDSSVTTPWSWEHSVHGSQQLQQSPKVSKRHAPNLSFLLRKLRHDRTMTPMKKRTGRPSRGPRDSFNIKLPLADSEKLRTMADLQKVSLQDLIEPMISNALAEIDIDSLKGQEALPIGRLAS